MNDFVNQIVSTMAMTNTTQTRFHASKKGKKCFTTGMMSFPKEDAYRGFKRKIQS